MRGSQGIRQLRMLLMFARGRALRLEHFKPLFPDMHTKTIRRELQQWVDCAEANVSTGVDQAGRWWRMSLVPNTLKFLLDKNLKDLPKEKTCNKCGRKLPTTNEFFQKHPNSPDGLQWNCRECNRERNRAWYAKNAQKINQLRARKRAQKTKGIHVRSETGRFRSAHGWTVTDVARMELAGFQNIERGIDGQNNN